MAAMVFSYDPKKIKKLDDLAENQSRTRSGYIQLVLIEYVQQYKKPNKK